MDPQEGTTASSTAGGRPWKDWSLEGSQVFTTLRASTTEKEYNEGPKHDGGTEKDFRVVTVPNDLKRPYNETKPGNRAFPYPSTTLLARNYLDLRKAQGGHDDKTGYYASENSRLLRPLNRTCRELAQRLAFQAKTQNQRSLLFPGGPSVVVHEHLYNENREKVMTYSLESRLGTDESGSSIQASTVASVSKAIAQVNEEGDSEEDEEGDSEEDAECMTDNDEYDQACETDTTDAERASDEEDYKNCWGPPAV